MLQLIEVSNNYLRYSTESKVKISKHKTISTPKLSLCFREYEILRRDFMKHKMKNLPPLNIGDTAWGELRNNITIREIFMNTPSIDEVSQHVKYEYI